MSKKKKIEKATIQVPETRDQLFSISDPRLAEWLGIANNSLAGVSVNEKTALGLSAYYRGVNIISGTIAGLPLKTYRDLDDGTRIQVASVFDDPNPWMTQFEWIEFLLVSLLIHGNAYFLKILNGAGTVIGFQPIHPSCVTIELEEYGNELIKVYRVSLINGDSREYTDIDILHIPALSTDGICGLSPLQVHRNGLGTGIAGNEAASRMFGSGLLVGGFVSLGEDVDPEDAKEIKIDLENRLKGVKNAGDVAFVNASLKFTPWAMTARDGQFIESRAFQIEEIARILGIPPHLLAQTEKQTSWGSGVAEQQLGLQKYTLKPWTDRIEQRLSKVLSNSRFVEFEYKGLLKGTPKEEIEMLKTQIEAGILTVNEARAILNLEPLDMPTPPPNQNPVMDPNQMPAQDPMMSPQNPMMSPGGN